MYYLGIQVKEAKSHFPAIPVDLDTETPAKIVNKQLLENIQKFVKSIFPSLKVLKFYCFAKSLFKNPFRRFVKRH